MMIILKNALKNTLKNIYIILSNKNLLIKIISNNTLKIIVKMFKS